MQHSDPEIQRKLTSAAPRYSGNVDLDLSAVLDRGRVRQRRRGLVRSSVAAVVAVGISLPVFAAGYVVRGASEGNGVQAQPADGPIESISSKYGGTLAWTPNGDETRLESVNQSAILPSDLQGGLVSPSGIEGGVYAFRGEVPPGDNPVIWHPNGTTVDVEIPAADPYDLTLPAWAPDGKRLAAELCSFAEAPSGECSVVLISAADGSIETLVKSNSQGVSWSPDGSRIAFISPDRSLSVIDVNSGVVHELLARGDEYTDLFRPSWSPGGEYIAVTAGLDGEDVPLVLTSAGQVVGMGQGSQGSPPAIAWRMGSDTLLTASMRVSGTAPGDVATSVQLLSAPDWTPVTILQLDGNTRPDLFVSPGGVALLIQTLDQAAASSPAATGTPYSWTVVEIDDGNLSQWDVMDALILDWE
jgi:WD40 repeat protein